MPTFVIHYVTNENDAWSQIVIVAKSLAQAEAQADVYGDRYGWFTWFVRA